MKHTVEAPGERTCQKSTRKLALFYAFVALASYGTLNADPQLYDRAPETASLPFSPILQSAPDKVRLNEVTLEDLPRSNVTHGYFLFGYDTHQLQIPANEILRRTWTPTQTKMLNDHEINLTREEARCQSYGYALPKNPRRRRLFMGALIADDSLEVLSAVSAEAYDIFHTVAFVESNTTFTGRTPRGFRFGPGSGRHRDLYQLFGPGTRVSVDYYVSVPNDMIDETGWDREVLQRDAVQRRWHKNGMRPDDVAIFMDSDEAFTRDFLRAMQICDVPEFRPGQDCMAPKIMASTLVFESSPECITKGRRWYHPDAVVGECVELIGNSTVHPHAKRQYRLNGKEESVGLRVPGQGNNVWSSNDGYSDFKTGPYPLWTAEDIRTGAPGTSKVKAGNLPTGYHFHNFFEDAREIRFKYSTYGEPVPSLGKPIWEIHTDVALGCYCATNDTKKMQPFAVGENAEVVRPIYYLDDAVRRRRHARWKSIVEGEKGRFEAEWSDRKEEDESADEEMEDDLVSDEEEEDESASREEEEDAEASDEEEEDESASGEEENEMPETPRRSAEEEDESAGNEGEEDVPDDDEEEDKSVGDDEEKGDKAGDEEEEDERRAIEEEKERA